MSDSVQSPPTVLDYAYRAAFIVAHRLLRVYWHLRHPHKGGTLVAVWHQGRILIVKNTYRSHHTLPGGYPRAGETPAEAGARELAEECDIHVRPDEVREVYRGSYMFEGRHDDATIVEIELPSAPSFRIDNREVSSARLLTPEEVKKLLVVPHLRDYLERRSAGIGQPPVG